VNSLKLPPAPGADLLERAVEALGEEPCLLLLDNFEHLLRDASLATKNVHPALGGGGMAIVRLLLERTPRLTCLITSRQPLHLGGEREFPVAPLPVPVDSLWLMVDGPTTVEGRVPAKRVVLRVEGRDKDEPV